MQAAVWEALLRRIPVARHESLIVTTSTGIEMMVTRILRLERDVLLMRARLGGSTDEGRIIMLPYEQINNVAFNRVLAEAEVQSIFGPLETAESFAAEAAKGAPAAAGASSSEAKKVEEPAPRGEAPPTVLPPIARPPAASPSPAPVPAPAAGPAPSKSILLARLRARLASEPRNP